MLLTIFDGTTDLIKFKQDVDVSNFNYSRDLTTVSKSKISGFDTDVLEEMKPKLGDYIYFYLLDDELKYPIVGKICDISFKNNVFDISLLSGVDINTNEVYIPNNSLDGYDISDSNYSSVEVHAVTTAACTTTDKNLTFDTLNRQAMRKNSMKEETIFIETIGEEKILVELTDVADNIIYEVRYDDPGISYSLSYGTDTFNWYRMRLQDDSETDIDETSQVIDMYLYEDGSVGTDVSKAVKPLIQKVEFVESTSFNEDHGITELKGQEYANKLVINTTLDNDIYGLNYDTDILGRKLIFYDPSEKEINTFISGVDIKDNKMIVTCGLTRTKLTKKINREV